MGVIRMGEQRLANQDIVKEVGLLRKDAQARHDIEESWRAEMLDQAKQQTKLLEQIRNATDYQARAISAGNPGAVKPQ